MYGTTERGVNMCTRFVYNGNDTVVGFNFDIGLSVWTHTVITEMRLTYSKNNIEILACSFYCVPNINGTLSMKKSR